MLKILMYSCQSKVYCNRMKSIQKHQKVYACTVKMNEIWTIITTILVVYRWGVGVGGGGEGIVAVWTEKMPPKKLLKFTRFYWVLTFF